MSAWFLDGELSTCYNVDQRFPKILCHYCDGTSASYVTWTSHMHVLAIIVVTYWA